MEFRVKRNLTGVLYTGIYQNFTNQIEIIRIFQ